VNPVHNSDTIALTSKAKIRERGSIENPCPVRSF